MDEGAFCRIYNKLLGRLIKVAGSALINIWKNYNNVLVKNVSEILIDY